MSDGDVGRRLVSKLSPGDEFSLVHSSVPRRVRIAFKDGTEIRVILAAGQKIDVKIGTAMVPEFFTEDLDAPPGIEA